MGFCNASTLVSFQIHRVSAVPGVPSHDLFIDVPGAVATVLSGWMRAGAVTWHAFVQNLAQRERERDRLACV